MRNNGGIVENGFVSMRLMHQGSCEMWKIEVLSERKFYRNFRNLEREMRNMEEFKF